MVRFDDFSVFEARARRLVSSTLAESSSSSSIPSPSATKSKKLKKPPRVARCVIKYQHARGKLQVRVTDDKTCLQFSTDQLSDVKRVERLSAWLVEAQATGVAPPAPSATASEGGGVGAAAEAAAKAKAAAAASGATTGGGGKASAGGKGGAGKKGGGGGSGKRR